MNYIKNVLIALDQLANALIGGWPDESLSSRAWREYCSGQRLWPKRLIDALLWFDKNHCEESYKSEILRRQLPPSMREWNEPPPHTHIVSYFCGWGYVLYPDCYGY